MLGFVAKEFVDCNAGSRATGKTIVIEQDDRTRNEPRIEEFEAVSRRLGEIYVDMQEPKPIPACGFQASRNPSSLDTAGMVRREILASIRLGNSQTPLLPPIVLALLCPIASLRLGQSLEGIKPPMRMVAGVRPG